MDCHAVVKNAGESEDAAGYSERTIIQNSDDDTFTRNSDGEEISESSLKEAMSLEEENVFVFSAIPLHHYKVNAHC